MKRSEWVAAIGLAVVSLSGLPAKAATYYCDNDRSASQYPQCRGNNAGYDGYPDTFHAWTYRSGRAGDWNGDDRINAYPRQYYLWLMKTQTRYSWQAWLANASFTDPRATYTVSYNNDIRTNRVIAVINQNTAPATWNSLGHGAFLSNEIDVKSSGTGTTGADIVRGITASVASASPAAREEEVARPGACPPLAPVDPQVAQVRDRMLGATTRYRDVVGDFDLAFSNNRQTESVHFESSPAQARSMVEVTDAATGRRMAYASDAGIGTTFDRSARTYETSALAHQPRSERPRILRDSGCAQVYVHAANPSGAIGADDVIDPQNYAFWLDGGTASVEAHARHLGRAVTVVAGRHDAYLAHKLGAVGYRMWVDDATGTLLKLVGSDAAGRVAYFVEVRAIRFDTGAAGLKRRAAIPAGYVRLQRPAFDLSMFGAGN